MKTTINLTGYCGNKAIKEIQKRKQNQENLKSEVGEVCNTFDNSKNVHRPCFDSNKSAQKKTYLVGGKPQVSTSTKSGNSKLFNKFPSAYNHKLKNDLKANKSSGAIKLKPTNNISFSSSNNISGIATKVPAQKAINMKQATSRLISSIQFDGVDLK